MVSLSAQYTPAHPDMIDVKQQIADVKAELEAKYGSEAVVNLRAKQDIPPGQVARPSSITAPKSAESAIDPAENSETPEEEKAEKIETARLLAVLLDSGRVVLAKHNMRSITRDLKTKDFLQRCLKVNSERSSSQERAMTYGICLPPRCRNAPSRY